MMERGPDISRGRWLAPLLIVFIGAIAYSNSLHGPFIFDDVAAIVQNPQIRSLNPFKYPPAGPNTVAGRPVLIFSFAADYAISRLKVEIYHVTNLIIHLAAGLTLYGIVRRTLLRKGVNSATWVSAIVAAIWISHPLNTQSVTYLAQRAESLASLFLLLSLYCLIRAIDGRKWWGVAAVVVCGLGMASKEIVAAAPFLAILYDRTFVARSFKEAWARRWKIYVGMAATWVLILLSLHTGLRETMVGFHVGISPLEYARTEANVIALYLRLAFWPVNLVLDYYGCPMARNWEDVSWQGWIVLGLVVGTIVALKYKPWLGFLGACFFLVLAPTSSFLPIKQEAAAEQRMYFPLGVVVCLLVVCAWGIVRRRRWSRAAGALAACLVIIELTRLTMARNDQYASAVDIWTDTVAKRPDNTRARVNLGEAWAQASLDFSPGSSDAQAAARQAEAQFEIVLEMEPRISEAVFAIGQSLERLGDTAGAEDLYTRAISKYPDVAGDLLLERGNLRARRQDWAEAKADFLAAIAANPENVEPHYFLGVLYEQLGDWGNAGVELAKAVAIAPKYKDAAARLDKANKLAQK